jgi:predicted aspartyl protease
MPVSFDPRQGLIVVRAELVGPGGSALLRLALDTGATWTLVNMGMLVSIGYDPGLTSERYQVTTGSGIEYVPRVELESISALGQERLGFPVLCHTLPAAAGVDGLLGVDFIRGQALTIDFRSGVITLA